MAAADNSPPSPKKPLRVLMVEDRQIDAELVLAELRRAGYAPSYIRVDHEPELREALKGDFEIVLSDFAMPQFNGLRALEVLQESGVDIPFIIISGTIGEEMAVAAMRRGVADYLLKDRLARLGSAVEGALKAHRERRERLAMTGEIERSRERLASAQRLARMGSFETDFVTGRLEWSEGLYFLFGRDPALGPPRLQELRSWIHPEERAYWDEVQAGYRLGVGPELREHRLARTGGIFWGEIRVSIVRDPSGKPIAIKGTVVDISERKQQQRAVLESEARLRQIAENIDEVIWMSDPVAKKSLYLSPQFERVFGRTRKSHEENPHDWINSVLPEDKPRLLEAVARRDLGEPFDETYRISKPDGAIRWIRERTFAIPDAHGFPYRIVGTAVDITEQKQLEEQLLRSQRLQAVGTLSSGIAHDLNNILAPILMVSSLLRPKLTDPHDEEMLAIVEQGAQRGAAIIRQLLTFSRGTTGTRMLIHIEGLIGEMLSLIRETFPKEISAVKQVPDTLDPVMGDPTQIHQVIMNLCVNARDAMEGKGTLTIAAHNEQVSAAEAKLHPPAKPGTYVVVSVGDTGCGMTPEVIDRIFEPFFTTKEIGKGSGLGLASVAGIIRSHQGFLTVFSEPGVGSLFKVHIPSAPDEARRGSTGASAPMVMGHGETVLVVDDEPNVCAAAAGILKKNGYRAMTSTDGQKALGLFLESGAAVDLLVTDLMMPRMGGITLIRSLRTVEPNLKIVAMTGLDEETSREELSLMDVHHVLPKPFSPIEFMEAIGSALADDGPNRAQ